MIQYLERRQCVECPRLEWRNKATEYKSGALHHEIRAQFDSSKSFDLFLKFYPRTPDQKIMRGGFSKYGVGKSVRVSS